MKCTNYRQQHCHFLKNVTSDEIRFGVDVSTHQQALCDTHTTAVGDGVASALPSYTSVAESLSPKISNPDAIICHTTIERH